MNSSSLLQSIKNTHSFKSQKSDFLFALLWFLKYIPILPFLVNNSQGDCHFKYIGKSYYKMKKF